MKKLILILSLTLLSTNAWSKCSDAPDMAKNIDGEAVAQRCENKEAICYIFGDSVSCFKK